MHHKLSENDPPRKLAGSKTFSDNGIDEGLSKPLEVKKTPSKLKIHHTVLGSTSSFPSIPSLRGSGVDIFPKSPLKISTTGISPRPSFSLPGSPLSFQRLSIQDDGGPKLGSEEKNTHLLHSISSTNLFQNPLNDSAKNSTPVDESVIQESKPPPDQHLFRHQLKKRHSILFSMLLHYILCGFFIVGNIAFGSIGQFRKDIIPLYVACCFATAESSRLIIHRFEKTILPLYITLLTYPVFHFLTFEYHVILQIVWFASSLYMGIHSLYLPAVTRHWFVYSILFFGLSLALTALMIYVYPDYIPMLVSPFYIPRGMSLWTMEALVFIGLLFIAANVRILSRFIYDLSVQIVRRQSKIDFEIRRKSWSFQKDPRRSFDIPIMKIIRELEEIMLRPDITQPIYEKLKLVLHILKAGHIHVPNINFGTNTQMVHTWLNKSTTLENLENSDNDLQSKLAEASKAHRTSLRRRKQSFSFSKSYERVSKSKVSMLLHNLDQWTFDIFELRYCSNGRTLYYVVQNSFQKMGLMELFQLDSRLVGKFLDTIEKQYGSNPYHNSIHGADVTQAMFFFLKHFKIALPLLEVLALLIAAAIHDFDHPGVNNNFLIYTGSQLATTYNDTSILENHHCSEAFRLLLLPECNFLHNMSKDTFQLLRSNIIKVVLATNISQHFDHMCIFQNKLATQGLDMEIENDRQLLMVFAMKCADVSNPCRPLATYWKWVEAITEEFFQQGDLEKEAGLEISSFMDRTAPNVEKCQLNFIEYFVLPMFQCWSLLEEETSHANPLLFFLHQNMEYLKSLQ